MVLVDIDLDKPSCSTGLDQYWHSCWSRICRRFGRYADTADYVDTDEGRQLVSRVASAISRPACRTRHRCGYGDMNSSLSRRREPSWGIRDDGSRTIIWRYPHGADETTGSVNRIRQCIGAMRCERGVCLKTLVFITGHTSMQKLDQRPSPIRDYPFESKITRSLVPTRHHVAAPEALQNPPSSS